MSQSLVSLPNEILTIIIQEIEDLDDLGAFFLTCRGLHLFKTLRSTQRHVQILQHYSLPRSITAYRAYLNENYRQLALASLRQGRDLALVISYLGDPHACREAVESGKQIWIDRSLVEVWLRKFRRSLSWSPPKGKKSSAFKAKPQLPKDYKQLQQLSIGIYIPKLLLLCTHSSSSQSVIVERLLPACPRNRNCPSTITGNSNVRINRIPIPGPRVLHISMGWKMGWGQHAIDATDVITKSFWSTFYAFCRYEGESADKLRWRVIWMDSTAFDEDILSLKENRLEVFGNIASYLAFMRVEMRVHVEVLGRSEEALGRISMRRSGMHQLIGSFMMG